MVTAVFAVVPHALAGCAREAEVAKPTPGTLDAPWVIGVSQCDLSDPWRAQMNEDIRRAAEAHRNLRVIWRDAQNDAQRQSAQLEDLLEHSVDLLIISPVEAAPLTGPVAEVFRREIPVIVLDRPVQGNEFTTFIGADNRRIGREAGAWAADVLGGHGSIVEIMGSAASTSAQDRHEGFIEGLDRVKNTDIAIVFEADMQWLEPNARKAMKTALALRPDIDLVYAHTDLGARGAYLEAREARREKDIRFIGINALPQEGIAYVKQGILDAAFLYPTGGAEAIETSLTILRGEAAPKVIALGTRLFTKESAERGGDEVR
jgi:ribose transport system substrate-binding protein